MDLHCPAFFSSALTKQPNIAVVIQKTKITQGRYTITQIEKYITTKNDDQFKSTYEWLSDFITTTISLTLNMYTYRQNLNYWRINHVEKDLNDADKHISMVARNDLFSLRSCVTKEKSWYERFQC